MLAAICSIEEETSSTEADCSVEPWDNCSALALISWLPAMTWSEADWMFDITSVRPSTILARACISLSSAGPLLDLDPQVAARDFFGGGGDLIHGIDEHVNIILDQVVLPLVLGGYLGGDTPLETFST